ncbi:MAG: response regulator transcription factor [Gammaproteobacteria bacterium]|nr:response regulator transcription factor [Gammaproteobacteria bacterium]
MSLVLVVEDDPAILQGLADTLSDEGYDVLTAQDGEAGDRLLRDRIPDLVVLDLMLPKMSGHELCRRARRRDMTMPILMLTARSAESDRVTGLDLGADDYLTKPFSVPELLARVRALLRRANPMPALPDELRFGDVTIDFRRYEAWKGSRALDLTPKEYDALRFLAARPGEVATREELLREVWRYRHFPATRTVDNHVSSLRAKIEDDPSNPQHLLTVHGRGYKLVI